MNKTLSINHHLVALCFLVFTLVSVTGRATLYVTDVVTYQDVDELIDSHCAGPCSIVFIYHPPTKNLVASHLSEYAFGTGELSIARQFETASMSFPITEAQVFVSGVAGPLDDYLLKRRKAIEELVAQYDVPKNNIYIEWLDDYEIGRIHLDMPSETAKFFKSRYTPGARSEWRNYLVVSCEQLLKQ